MNRSLVVIAIGICTIGICTQIAAADPANKSAGKAEFSTGKRLYANGDYLGAASHFEAAFRHDPDPAYIFNVGQAYRRRAEQKAGNIEVDCQKSMAAYKQFLTLIPNPPNRKEADTYIKEMERCAGKLASEPVDQPPVDKPPVDKPPVDKPIDNPPVDKPVDNPPIDTPRSSRDPKQIIGIGVGVAGLVACGVGAFFLKQGIDLTNQHDAAVKDPPDNAAELIEELDADGARSERNAAIAFVAGGAMVIGGTVLFIVGRGASKEQRITVVPTRDGAAVVGTFRF
jgi:tetratricopeptide (TPR) repeat protein